MVKRENNNFGETDKLNERETNAPPAFQTKFSSISKKPGKESTASDELIRSLSDAYENKRARQVFEWEIVRRQDFHRAA